ncbi:hypothetical protein [Deinococcus yunweiensis]|uniref:hypothetical protein n=1 Tax=Deinococcus yunweiensis TaxID=367282 RepID=UPI00398F58CE
MKSLLLAVLLTSSVAQAQQIWEYGVLSVADVYSKDRKHVEDQEYSWTVAGRILFASRSGTSLPSLILTGTGVKVDPNSTKGGNDFEPWRVTVMNAFGQAGWELTGVQSTTGTVLGVYKTYQMFWMKRLKP